MIISVDPGGSTGMAFRLDDAERSFACITIPGYDIPEVVGQIAKRATIVQAVVIESFLGIQYRSAHGIETLELLGAVRGVCALLGIPCIKQAPAQRTAKERIARTMLQERTKALGLAFTPHEVSALAHLLTFEAAVSKAAGIVTTAPPVIRKVARAKRVISGRKV